jgi:hypothetical protein
MATQTRLIPAGPSLRRAAAPGAGLRGGLLRTGALVRGEPWLLLFYVLAAAQSGHFLEHVAQMVQLHVLGLSGPQARGVVGALDLEWVHFVWNTGVLLAVGALAAVYRGNRWLLVTLLLAGWHELEHVVIMARYLSTGLVGTPGLLAAGGALGGGAPLARPDLHFLYNLVETVPLLLAFAFQVRHATAPPRATAGHRRARRAGT